MGAASALSDHDFSFSAVFTHILHLGRKMALSNGHRTPVLNPLWEAKCEYADQSASDLGLHYFPQPFCQHLELLW